MKFNYVLIKIPVLILLVAVMINGYAFKGSKALAEFEPKTLPANGLAGLALFAPAGSPNLALPYQAPAVAGSQVILPVTYTANGNDISTLAFSIDYDQTWLSFNPADSDGDGVPDAVTHNLPAAFNLSVFFDINDTDGELDVYIADAFPPLSALPDGGLVAITFDVSDSAPSTIETPVTFSPDPAASFGNTTGQSVLGTTTDGSILIRKPVICQVQGMTISPAPIAADEADLTLSYQCLAAGGEPVNNTLIRWHRRGDLQPAFNDQKVIPAAVTWPVETWCATVIPYDGVTYGVSETQCVYIEQKPNSPPLATVTITPTMPLDDEGLRLNYACDDDDPGDICQLEKRWYRNGRLAATYNNQDTLSASVTTPGDTWCVTAQPSDGQEVGPIAGQYCVTIGSTSNHLPRVLSPTITVTPPDTLKAASSGAATQTSGYTLTLNYTYLDLDDPTEAMTQTKIRWYRDNYLEPAFNEQLTVPGNVTGPGEVWYATVRPHDGQGLGPLARTAPVSLKDEAENTLPTASEVYITPARPGDDHFLRLTYQFWDGDGDIEGGTEIRWFKNQVHQPEYDGQTFIPISATSLGDVWYATVRPYDDKGHFGPLETSYSVRIGSDTHNTPPVAYDVYIAPRNPGDDSRLEVFYQYFDDDGDLEGETVIRWTVNGVPQSPQLDKELTIAPYLTDVTQEWCATVTPHDGLEAGETVSAACVTINSVPGDNRPEAENPHIEPPNPTTEHILMLAYEFVSGKGMPEGNSEIHWFRDGAEVETYVNLRRVPASATQPREKWYATIKPCAEDGECGLLKLTPPVQINTPPVLGKVEITPRSPCSNQDLVITYTYSDTEHNPPEDPGTRWFRNQAHISKYDNKLHLPATATQAGDLWSADVTLHDGLESSQQVISAEVTVEKCFYFVHLPFIAKPKPSNPPHQPGNPSPADEATGQPVVATLSWTGGDPDPDDTVTYDVYLGPSYPPATLVCDDVTGTICQPAPLNYHTLYYWQVVATDNQGGTVTGPVWRFSTPSCVVETFFEENDRREQACGPILPGQIYEAYPDDENDYFYFELEESATITIKVTNYAAAKPGQLQLLDGEIKNKLIAYDPDLHLSAGGIPNGWFPASVTLRKPGKYYIRLYTLPEAFDLTTRYQLVVTLSPPLCRECE